MLIENALYYVNPPERAAIQQRERSPVDMFVSKLIYVEMNKRTHTKVLKTIRKLHWEDQEVVTLLEKIFSKPGKVKYSSIHLLAILLGSLQRYHLDFVVTVIDNVLEQITLGLELNDFKFNQRRLAEVKYLAELYNFKMIDSPIVFETLHRIVNFGHPAGYPIPGTINSLDMPDDFFRIRLICTLLEFCGQCFDRGAARKKLDFFLQFFQYYIHTKDPRPMDIDFLIQDAFALLRPDWKLHASLEEAGGAFAEVVKQNVKTQEQERPTEHEPVEEGGDSDDEADDEDVLIPRMQEAESSEEETDAEAENEQQVNSDLKHDSDFEEDIVVTRKEEARDVEAEAEFDKEFAKMMSESLDSRKFDRKPLFDVPLPMRKAQREVSVAAGDDSGNEGTAMPSDTNTMAFSLMTKKGNRQQVGFGILTALEQADSFERLVRSRCHRTRNSHWL